MWSTAGLICALVAASVHAAPTVDTRFPYTGPKVPVGDWVDPTVNGNGKGFQRLYEDPAVVPQNLSVKNNINVISMSILPDGMNIHFQTPFGIGGNPVVKWGTSASDLTKSSTGFTNTYDRTPACTGLTVTQCSQYFHEVPITGLSRDTTYYYQIPGGNGTTPSDVLSFTTPKAKGDSGAFTIAILNDMGYTNAKGTHEQLTLAARAGAAFAWHGGDISYADDWYSGILACDPSWDVCSDGLNTSLPGDAPVPAEYLSPLPAGEVANQGGPLGGDISTVYETNWDLWQNWMNPITKLIPYMVLPGNHEAACAEFDGAHNELTAYLVNNESNSTAAKTNLTYYSCPESQRNYTAYINRFHMSGSASGGVGNFWYSFDVGQAHFISFNGETDYYKSPEYPFLADLKGNETLPTESETYITDSGPFGRIDGNNWKDNKAYEQYQWLQYDLQQVDRSKTPWVFAMSHRPMYSSEVSSYQANMRAAFEALFLKYGVDAYFAGHIHWYERMYPMGLNSTIVKSSMIDANTYKTCKGTSMVHITNGNAGNIESHSVLGSSPKLNLTAVLNQRDYGYGRLTVHNASMVTFEQIKGVDGSVGDKLTIVKDT